MDPQLLFGLITCGYTLLVWVYLYLGGLRDEGDNDQGPQLHD
jgi:hypothetical protein